MSLTNMERGPLKGLYKSSPGDLPGREGTFGSTAGPGSATHKLESIGFFADNEARKKELEAQKQMADIKDLQRKAGIIQVQAERLDWMYEQSASQRNDDDKMNEKVKLGDGQEMQKVKKLATSSSGSLFLSDSTKTTEDVLRKLREDPLFQIRQEEQKRRDSVAANPLQMAKLEHLKRAVQKQQSKKEKKALKKEKKKLKKEKKKMKKALKKKKGSSSSSSDSSSSPSTGTKPVQAKLARKRSRSPSAGTRLREKAERAPPTSDVAHLGPSKDLIGAREERAMLIKERKDAALASRGLGSRLSKEEAESRVKEMVEDGKKHQGRKEVRIGEYEKKEQAKASQEEEWRRNKDNTVFKKMQKEVYMNSEQSLEERMQSRRHRRQKDVLDPLERD